MNQIRISQKSFILIITGSQKAARRKSNNDQLTGKSRGRVWEGSGGSARESI